MEFISKFLYDTSEEITVRGVAAAIITAMLCGIIIGVTYMKTAKKSHSQSFVITLAMLPLIMGIIILFVGSNVARAFSMAGTLSIIRFRSAPGEPHDIGYIFFDIAAGLSCGIGLFGYGLMFTVIMCLFLMILSKIDFGKNEGKILKITIPEDLNFDGAFDDVIEKYTKRSNFVRVRTTDLGSLFEIVYRVCLKDGTDKKSFIDEIRIRNGNLPVVLTVDHE